MHPYKPGIVAVMRWRTASLRMFSVANSNIDALQHPNTCRSLSEIGAGIYKYFERAKEPDKQVGEISVDDSGQIGP